MSVGDERMLIAFYSARQPMDYLIVTDAILLAFL
jgi:hypothetical protein